MFFLVVCLFLGVGFGSDICWFSVLGGFAIASCVWGFGWVFAVVLGLLVVFFVAGLGLMFWFGVCYVLLLTCVGFATCGGFYSCRLGLVVLVG